MTFKRMKSFYRLFGRKQFVVETQLLDKFKVVIHTGMIGSKVEHRQLLEYSLVEHPYIATYTKGNFIHYPIDPSNGHSVLLQQGDLNDKFIPRKVGLYVLESLTDNSEHICVTSINEDIRPNHERVVLKTTQQNTIPPANIVVTIGGGFVYTKDQPLVITGPKEYERFWL